MADPLERRLRELARDTEPLIILSGPGEARRRGERRTSRRRTGAVAVVAAAAISIGVWQLLPGLGTQSVATPGPGASVQPGTPGVPDLTEELLPPSAMPWYPMERWRIVPYTRGNQGCLDNVFVFDGVVGAASRQYEGSKGRHAEYHIYRLATRKSTAKALVSIDTALKRCELRQISGAQVPSSPDTLHTTYIGKPPGAPATQTWVADTDTSIAVLQITGSGPVGHDYSDPWPVRCMAKSLQHLSPATSTPTPTATKGGSGAGIGFAPEGIAASGPATTDWSAPPGTHESSPDVYTFPTHTPNRC